MRGIAMSAFTVIVQNQYPTHRLGEVTAGLQFFRQIGSTVGLAVFGTIMNNQFAAAMKTNLPAPLQKLAHGSAASRLENPQVLLSPTASEKIHADLAEGWAMRVRSTPTYFIDGVYVSWYADNIMEEFLRKTYLGGRGLPLPTPSVASTPAKH